MSYQAEREQDAQSKSRNKAALHRHSPVVSERETRCTNRWSRACWASPMLSARFPGLLRPARWSTALSRLSSPDRSGSASDDLGGRKKRLHRAPTGRSSRLNIYRREGQEFQCSRSSSFSRACAGFSCVTAAADQARLGTTPTRPLAVAMLQQRRVGQRVLLRWELAVHREPAGSRGRAASRV